LQVSCSSGEIGDIADNSWLTKIVGGTLPLLGLPELGDFYCSCGADLCACMALGAEIGEDHVDAPHLGVVAVGFG